MWFYLMRCAGWLLWGPAANAAYGVGLCGAGLRQSGHRPLEDYQALWLLQPALSGSTELAEVLPKGSARF
jgi:hypothetical protein